MVVVVVAVARISATFPAEQGHDNGCHHLLLHIDVALGIIQQFSQHGLIELDLDLIYTRIHSTHINTLCSITSAPHDKITPYGTTTFSGTRWCCAVSITRYTTWPNMAGESIRANNHRTDKHSHREDRRCANVTQCNSVVAEKL